MPPRIARPFILPVLVAGLMACGTAASNPADVVATTPVWAEITSAVGCGIEVPALIPGDADHHADEPSLADRARVDAARLVVANGGGLEGGWISTLDATPTPVLDVAASLNLHDDEHHDDEHHDGDPHLWLDPQLVVMALPSIEAALINRAGLDPAAVADCRSAVAASLTALAARLRARFDTLAPAARSVVTDHAFLTHLAGRYGLEVVGTIVDGHSSLHETNPRRLERLADLIGTSEVRVIVTVDTEDPADARRLADATGATLIRIPVSPRDGDDLAGLLDTIADQLIDALDG